MDRRPTSVPVDEDLDDEQAADLDQDDDAQPRQLTLAGSAVVVGEDHLGRSFTYHESAVDVESDADNDGENQYQSSANDVCILHHGSLRSAYCPM